MNTNENQVCDTCGVKAYYRVANADQELYFCGNHARKNSESLLEKGFTIYPDNYNEFGAELQEDFEAKTKAAKHEKEQDRLEEFETVRNRVKRMFYSNPAAILNDIFIPTARNETQYSKQVKMHLDLQPNFAFTLEVQPLEEPANEQELIEFMVFNTALRSIINSTLK